MDNTNDKAIKTRVILIASIVCILVVIAITGYGFLVNKEPLRVALATKGGDIIFDHQYHTDNEAVSCKDCHHDYDPDKKSNEMNCRTCHISKDENIKAGDDIHKTNFSKNCIECHISGSVSCTFCHNAENFTQQTEPESVEFLTINGTVIFDHFKHASPEGMELNCAACHHGYKDERGAAPGGCRRCHYNTVNKNICVNDDIHRRCIGQNCLSCHRDGSENCNLCHKR